MENQKKGLNEKFLEIFKKTFYEIGVWTAAEIEGDATKLFHFRNKLRNLKAKEPLEKFIKSLSEEELSQLQLIIDRELENHA